MNLTDIDSISKYNNFLRHLNAFGPFQKKLIAICISFWTFAGFVRTIFNKEVFCNNDDDLLFSTVSILMGILGSAYASHYYNRRIIMLTLSGIYSFGGLVLILSFGQNWIVKIGLCMVSFAHYSICIMASCIVLQYIEISLIPIVTWSMIFACHTSKFIAVIVFSQFDDSKNVQIILSSVILCFGLLEIGGSLLFRQSLRYLIDNDIQQAEIIALKVSEQNHCPDEKIIHLIQGSFVWNKVKIKKYGLSTLWKYKSLSSKFVDYMGLSFFFLGIFGKLAIVIFKINENKKSTEFDNQVQLFWISVFQSIGFLPGIILQKIIAKKKICITAAIVAFIFSAALMLLIRQIANPDYFVVIFSLLGLNSFVGSILFFFMFWQTVEFYSHTIRTLGLSICLCCYYLGQLVFNLHLNYVGDTTSSLQLIFSCTLVMIFHLYNTSESLRNGITYEIKEIEERQYNED